MKELRVQHAGRPYRVLPRDIRGCRNPARTRCARGLLHPGAPRNARGSYGRLEIRVVIRANDRRPFLRTSSHKCVGPSEALSRTHVGAVRKSDLWTLVAIVPECRATRK